MLRLMGLHEQVLLSKGRSVRGLVRDVDKAKELLVRPLSRSSGLHNRQRWNLVI